MTSQGIDVIMFNMSAYTEWQHGIANRNMHVLHTLLKDPRVRKVVAVDYLPFTLRRALRQWLQNVVLGVRGKVLARGFSYRLVAVRESELEATGYKLAGAAPDDVPYRLFVYSDVSSWRGEARVMARLKRELTRLDLKNVVVWSYLPTFVGWLSQLPHALTVFDAVDSWVEHSAYTAVKERLKLNYQTIAKQADLIFTTAQDLVRFFDRESGCTFVPNGVRLDEIGSSARIVGRDIASLPRPIVGYVGTLQRDRIDTALVHYLAEHNPQKSFVIIGATGLLWPQLSHRIDARFAPLPNLHFLGRKSYTDTRAYIREFNVGIIPHLMNEFNRHTNPLKLYEYLAAGKPVVATPTAGLEEFTGVVRLARTPEEFNQQLLAALQDSSAEAVSRRQEVVRRHSWESRVAVMLGKVFAALEAKGT